MQLNVGDVVQLSAQFMQVMQQGPAHEQMFPAFAATNGLAEVLAVDGSIVRITPARDTQLVGADDNQVILVLESKALTMMGCHKLEQGQPDAALPEPATQQLTVCNEDNVVEPRPGYDTGLPHPFAMGRVPAVVSQAYWIYGGIQTSKHQYANQAGELYESSLRYRREGDDEARPASIALGECENRLLISATNILGEYMAMQFETFKASYAAAKGTGNFFGAVAAENGQPERAEVEVVAEVTKSHKPKQPIVVQFNADW